ncbi:MAG: GNAT family N-acetyltransferase [Deltaproteobacteria bacterium]|nr:GNAT family N-acetyltransferase [Deltaproteobacteria bacterium]
MGDDAAFRLLAGLTFKVAEGPEIARALELRRQIYESELGHHGIDAFDERAHQLVAVDSTDEIVAAARILAPDQRPFEIERFVDLSRFIPTGRSPAQVGGFWIRPEDRRVRGKGFLPLGMLKLAYAFARKNGITDLVMRTHIQQLRGFYTRALFRPLDHMSFVHPDWGRVYVMHLDLTDLEACHSHSREAIARFLAADVPNIRV